jgi:hypothetical protein
VGDERVEHFGRGAAGATHAVERLRSVELDRAAASDHLGAGNCLILGHGKEYSPGNAIRQTPFGLSLSKASLSCSGKKGFDRLSTNGVWH